MDVKNRLAGVVKMGVFGVGAVGAAALAWSPPGLLAAGAVAGVGVSLMFLGGGGGDEGKGVFGLGAVALGTAGAMVASPVICGVEAVSGVGQLITGSRMGCLPAFTEEVKPINMVDDLKAGYKGIKNLLGEFKDKIKNILFPPKSDVSQFTDTPTLPSHLAENLPIEQTVANAPTPPPPSKTAVAEEVSASVPSSSPYTTPSASAKVEERNIEHNVVAHLVATKLFGENYTQNTGAILTSGGGRVGDKERIADLIKGQKSSLDNDALTNKIVDHIKANNLLIPTEASKLLGGYFSPDGVQLKKGLKKTDLSI